MYSWHWQCLQSLLMYLSKTVTGILKINHIQKSHSLCLNESNRRKKTTSLDFIPDWVNNHQRTWRDEIKENCKARTMRSGHMLDDFLKRWIRLLIDAIGFQNMPVCQIHKMDFVNISCIYHFLLVLELYQSFNQPE